MLLTARTLLRSSRLLCFRHKPSLTSGLFHLIDADATEQIVIYIPDSHSFGLVIALQFCHIGLRSSQAVIITHAAFQYAEYIRCPLTFPAIGNMKSPLTFIVWKTNE